MQNPNNYGAVFTEQIMKGTGQLEIILMYTIPVEYNRGYKRSYAADLGIQSSNVDKTVSHGEEKG